MHVCTHMFYKQHVLIFMIGFVQSWTSRVAQMVKRLPIMQETQVQSLAWEDPLEKEMGTNFSILTWKIPWTEESGLGLSP